MIRFPCPGCKKEIAVPNNLAGKSGKCSWCGADMTVPEPFAPGTQTDYDMAASEAPNRQAYLPLDDSNNTYSRYPEPQQPPASGGEGNAAMGWIVFILIFGVGNVILYATTGWLIIPIRR